MKAVYHGRKLILLFSRQADELNILLTQPLEADLLLKKRKQSGKKVYVHGCRENKSTSVEYVPTGSDFQQATEVHIGLSELARRTAIYSGDYREGLRDFELRVRDGIQNLS